MLNYLRVYIIYYIGTTSTSCPSPSTGIAHIHVHIHTPMHNYIYIHTNTHIQCFIYAYMRVCRYIMSNRTASNNTTCISICLCRLDTDILQQYIEWATDFIYLNQIIFLPLLLKKYIEWDINFNLP